MQNVSCYRERRASSLAGNWRDYLFTGYKIFLKTEGKLKTGLNLFPLWQVPNIIMEYSFHNNYNRKESAPKSDEWVSLEISNLYHGITLTTTVSGSLWRIYVTHSAVLLGVWNSKWNTSLLQIHVLRFTSRSRFWRTEL